MQIFGVKQEVGRASREIPGGGGEAEKLSGFILAMWGRAGPLSSQKSWRVLLGWGQLNPGEAQGIPAELKEGGHSQKERALFEKSR